jgi:hypothetical protein
LDAWCRRSRLGFNSESTGGGRRDDLLDSFWLLVREAGERTLVIVTSAGARQAIRDLLAEGAPGVQAVAETDLAPGIDVAAAPALGLGEPVGGRS